MDFYKRIKEYKDQNNITYSKLSAVIDKSPDAFRQALKRKSLSNLEVERLNSELFDPDKIIENQKTNLTEELNQLALQVIEMDNELKNNKIFNIYIQNKIQKGIIEYLEKEKTGMKTTAKN